MSAITAKASRKMKKYAVLTREPRCFLGSFDFSWEQRKLGEVIRLNGRIGFRGYTEKDIVSKDDGGVLTFSPTNIVDNKLTTNCKNTYITRFKYDESPEIKIHNGDILFVKTGSTLGKSALVTGLSEDATLNPQVVVMRTNNLNVEFLAAMLVTNAIISQVNSAKIGGAVPTLTETRIKDFDVAIPVSEAEKEQIGQFFSQLDNLITLHQRKFEKLTNVKKSMLEKMFPQNGSSYPEIRFKGFTDPWEQRKFDGVFDCTVPNNTLSRAELSYDEGTVLNVHYGDVLIKYDSVLDVQKDDIPRIPHRCREDFNGALLQDGDVIIADTAEDETTGKACEIGNLQGSAIVSGLHTMVCRPRNRMALGYLGYYLNSNAYHHQLLPLMQGIKVLSLSRSNIQKTSVSYPSAMKEQQLIASYFSQLDHLIALHQRELEKLQNIKKSMLEKMFV